MKKGILFLTVLTILSFSNSNWGRVWAHEHHPPHHGTLVELGEEFAHVELLLDPSTGGLTAFVLDGEAENPVEISQPFLLIQVKGKKGPFTVKLKPVASPLTGETVGNTSQYQGSSKNLKGLEKFEGTIDHIKAKGTEFSKVWFLYPEGNEGVKKPEEGASHDGHHQK